MPSLNDLPVELLNRTLKGAPLEDVLCVTRTSSFLRSVGFSSRALWKDAQDAHRLPLPMGQTLDTVSITSLSKLAARAISLSRTWSGSVAHARRISTLDTPYHPDFQSFRTLITPSGAILPGNQWILLGMNSDPHVYCLENGEYIPLGFKGNVISYTCESSNNGTSVTLAILKATWEGRPHDYDRFIDIFVLQFDPKNNFRTMPSVTKARSIYIPKYAQCIDLKGPLVVVSGDNQLFIANWKDGSGMNLSPSPNADPEEPLDDEEIFSLKAHFHPSLPLLVAEKRAHSCYSIHVVELPSELEPLKGPDLSDKGIIWPVDLLSSTCVHDVELQHVTLYRNFRPSDAEGHIFDVVSGPERRVPLELLHLSISAFGQSKPVAHRRFINPEGNRIIERFTAAGRTVCLGIRQNDDERTTHTLSFMCLPDGPREDATWVRLELPKDLTSTDCDVLVFDDVYGTLLLNDSAGNYHVIQY